MAEAIQSILSAQKSDQIRRRQKVCFIVRSFLDLQLARGQSARAGHDPSRQAEQIGFCEFFARAQSDPVVKKHFNPGRSEIAV